MFIFPLVSALPSVSPRSLLSLPPLSHPSTSSLLSGPLAIFSPSPLFPQLLLLFSLSSLHLPLLFPFSAPPPTLSLSSRILPPDPPSSPSLSHPTSPTPAPSSRACCLLLSAKAGSVIGGRWITHIRGLNQIKLQLNYTNKPIKCLSKSNFRSIPHIRGCKSRFSHCLLSFPPYLSPSSSVFSLTFFILRRFPLPSLASSACFTQPPTRRTACFPNLGFRLHSRQLVRRKES